jgi:hypothetical protein
VVGTLETGRQFSEEEEAHHSTRLTVRGCGRVLAAPDRAVLEALAELGEGEDVRNSARRGKTMTHQAWWMEVRPSAIMLPQVGKSLERTGSRSSGSPR